MKKTILAALGFALLFAACSSTAGVASTQEEEKTIIAEQPKKVDEQKPEQKPIDGKLTSIYFGFDKYNIQDSQKDALATDIEIVKSKGSKVKLLGNTDEFGTDEYNYALGLKRALSVRKAMELKGIKRSDVRMVSYGKSRPVCTEKTDECYQKNRRVDFKILGK